MAVTISNVLAGGGVPSGGANTTASWTPDGTSQYILNISSYVSAGSVVPAITSVTGNGLTWAKILGPVNGDNTGTDRTSQYMYAVPAGGSAGTITISWASAVPTRASWSLDKAAGAASGLGSGTLPQAAVSGASSAANPSAALGSALQSGSASYAAADFESSAGTLGAGSGYTALGQDTSQSLAWVISEWDSAGSTTATATNTTTANRHSIILIEVAAAATGTTANAGLATATGTAAAAHVPQTYFVSPAGSDAADGLSAGTAWQTLGKVSGTALGPGDTVLFQGGQTFTGLLHLTRSGTTLNPVTIGTYGIGAATITNGANNALWLDSAGGYAFQGISFTATTGSNAYTGANCFANGTGQLPAISFAGCAFSGGWQQGLTIGGSASADGWNGITITGCDASSNLYGGISIFGAAYNPSSPAWNHQNLLISGTTANGNTGSASVTTQGTGWGIDVASVNGGTVTGCIAHGNGASNGDTSSGPVGIWVSASNNVTVTGCLAYSNHSGTAADGDGFDLDLDCTNCTIEYCLAYSNDGAGILLYGGFSDNAWSGNTARYNITWGNGQVNGSYGEMTLGGQLAGAAVYGNTCVSRDGTSTFPSPLLLQYGPGLTGCTIRNNIFYGGGNGDLVYVGTAPATSGALLQGNLYYSPNTSTIHWGADFAGLVAWRAGASGQEQVSAVNSGLQADPRLVAPATTPAVISPADFSPAAGLIPQANSPVIGAGLDLLSLFGVNPGSRDFFGVTLSALPIGAVVTIGAAAATGTGAALNPAVTAVSAPAAVLASGTGTARNPVAAIGVNAALASGTGAARQPSAATAASVTAVLATGTGAALNATASTSASGTANAVLAAATGTAQQPAPAVAANAAAATGAGTALNAGRAATAGLASGTAAAQAAAAVLAAQARAQAAQALAAALNAAGGAVELFAIGTLTASDAPLATLAASAGADAAAATLTASDAPLATLAASAGADAAAATLTASDTRTGGPG